jgi:hypothetical protein
MSKLDFIYDNLLNIKQVQSLEVHIPLLGVDNKR